jgi:hypothetical protein
MHGGLRYLRSVGTDGIGALLLDAVGVPASVEGA